MTQGTSLDPNQLPSEGEPRVLVAATLAEQAQSARHRGELITAMLHASDALLLFPNDRPYLDLVDEIALASPDPLSLVPVSTGAVHVATAAARARILMMGHRLDEAISLVCEVVEVVPQVAYLDWVRRWLQPHMMERLGWEFLAKTAVSTALRLCVMVPAPADPKDPRVPNLRSAADYLSAIRAFFPAEPVLYVGEAMLRRRLGDPGATIAIAQAGVERFPEDWNARTALMNAYSDAKRPEQALDQAREALRIQPNDNSPLHDVAWAFADAGRMSDAASLFEELLGREKDYPGAQAALLYARVKTSGSPADRHALLLLREREWWDATARNLANQIDPPLEYFTYLPGPGDAAARASRQMVGELAGILRCCGIGGSLSWGPVSEYLESPSVPLAFETACRILGVQGELQIEVEQVQMPDPRSDKAELPYRVWFYEGMTPKKQYASADPRAQQAVAGIAAQLFRPDIWDPIARQVGSQCGPEWVHGFLAVMCNPPLPPEGAEFDGFIWTYRCQMAAALILSHIGNWETSPGRSALYSLAYGPSDWVVDAAIVALGWRALQNPALRGEVQAIYRWLRTQIPKQGFTSWERPLVQTWLGLGDHPEALRVELESWLEEYLESYPRKNRVRAPERRYGGLSLADYAEFSWERDRILGSAATQGLASAVRAHLPGTAPEELKALCAQFNIPLRHPEGVLGFVYPVISEWQTALAENRQLMNEFLEIQREMQFARMGVSHEEKAALDEILDGQMDMHLRMAQAQDAQRAMAEGQAGDPDPIVFPGQPVAKLSDYVGIMKRMQTGDMMGALAQYGLDFMSYGSVAQAWGAKMASDPLLTEKFNRMLTSS